MIETTETARTKWCPHTRQVWARVNNFGHFDTTNDTAAFNTMRESHGPRDQRCLCIAEACMMWRQLATMDTDNGKAQFGYCGLAGAPLSPDQHREIVEVQGLRIARRADREAT